jgi:feruloyl-CoA synthase
MFAPARVELERRQSDSILRSPQPLLPHAATLGEKLVEHAERTPDRKFLVERGRSVSYAETLTLIRGLGQTLLDLGLGPKRPLAILSGNSIDHALYTLAAMHVGVPAAPISPAYSLLAKDLGKLRSILEQLQPGAIFVDNRDAFARALSLVHLPVLDSLQPTSPAREIAIDGDSIAKILFTSGSTGAPKGVVNTQRMLCSNQQAIAQLWPFLARRPPIAVDWLPWSHTFGANHNFNMILWHGGTLHIDGGRPTPVGIQTTIANLREVSPTLYFNVPLGFAALLPFLENDSELRARFFAELDLVFYAAAALPDAIWRRLRALCDAPFVSAWGSTETSPLATMVHFPIERAGVIGLPAPGVEIKLARAGEKEELRVKGPNLTPGYWDRGAIVPAQLDADGFLPMGDAGKLADENHPERGLVFDGRLAENFKLSTGTWVAVGRLRVAILAACDPLVQDAVVCGHDRDSIALLLFARDESRDQIRDRLRAWNQREAHSSTRIVRFSILTDPPSIDHGEITDKGYLNQRACLERRAANVDALYADSPGGAIVIVD